MKTQYGLIAGLVVLAFAVVAGAQDTASKDAAKAVDAASKAQATCPVMGGAVDKNIYVDVKGLRVYACCGACVAKIKADPDPCLARIAANGETPERAPAAAPSACTAAGKTGCCSSKTDTQ